MRRLLSTVLLAAIATGLTACGDDEPTKASGPVTLTFSTQTHPNKVGTARDTTKGILTIDGTQTIDLPYDSVLNLPRGEHSFDARLTIDYLPVKFTQTIDPTRTTENLRIVQAGTCRIWVQADIPFCTVAINQPGNSIYWSQRKRIACPVNDFGDFCSRIPDPAEVGLSWPTDDDASDYNEYVAHGRLMIAGTVAPELGVDAGKKIATSLYNIGDYGPRRRLQVVPDDSSRYSVVNWTDLRHEPFFGFNRARLDYGDREFALFGLEVKTTYSSPAAFQDVIFIRFDIRNISAEEDYRRVHPGTPAGGFSVRDVYLTPMIDADIGGGLATEFSDDAATVFPDQKLIAGYDREFDIRRTDWVTRWADAPGIVGFQFLNSSFGGDARAVIFSADTLDFTTTALEAEAHTIVSGGRVATLAGCTATAELFNCAPEVGSDVRMGWSVGPIASIVPGQTYSVTVAVLLASPKPGSFSSGTGIAPQNTALTSTTRPIYNVTEALRALAAQIATQTVTSAP
jgi:hypothetical protein